MKITIRLAVLALAGYGAWKLYETYGAELPSLGGSVDKFSDSTLRATSNAADRVGSAVEDATAALTDSAADISDAAQELGASVTRDLRQRPAVPNASSS